MSEDSWRAIARAVSGDGGGWRQKHKQYAKSHAGHDFRASAAAAGGCGRGMCAIEGVARWGSQLKCPIIGGSNNPIRDSDRHTTIKKAGLYHVH